MKMMQDFAAISCRTSSLKSTIYIDEQTSCIDQNMAIRAVLPENS